MRTNTQIAMTKAIHFILKKLIGLYTEGMEGQSKQLSVLSSCF